MELIVNEDSKLVQKFCEGEIDAFRQIVERYKKRIFYFAFDLTGHQEDAEDLSQEVFIKMFKSIKKYKASSSLSTWLYRITVNTFIDKTRKISSKFEKNQEELTDRITNGTTSDKIKYIGDPESYTEGQQIQAHINKALSQLSPREQSVFVMRHYQAMQIKDVAEVLDISDGTVKSLLFRAIKKLQKILFVYRDSLIKEVIQ